MSGLLASSALLLTYLCALHDPADANVPSQLKQRQKTHLIDFMKRHQILLPPELDGKDDGVDKRQEFLFDDYGHMRFGKREESDDYGHLRFGRSHDE